MNDFESSGKAGGLLSAVREWMPSARALSLRVVPHGDGLASPASDDSPP